ncbi:MAG: hypothetical protein WAW36_15145, partial [Methylovulum miyakonense]|uniref:hypothetical protein n=1 Tax=Methylovulum miyakonense TaxID=645578 RepID=UPI003BB6FA49
RHGCRTAAKGQEAPFAAPRPMRGAQDISGNRAAFSLDTFFSTAWMPPLKGGLWTEVGQRRSSCRGGAKESISPSGARTRLKKYRDSDSTLFIFNSQKKSA